MLYLAIPAHNEVATIGVLLWRLRTVLAEFPREYEVVVYDDASTDETAEVAAQYEQAMPVTVLRGQSHLGYAGAVDVLLRHVAAQTRYPRRDAVLLLQGDFTDPPEIVPEFARRFEGGADLVVGERMVVADAPVAVRRLFKGAHWAMRPFVRVDGVRDLTASMRLVRISALRDALRVAGNTPLVTGDTWTANADLLLQLTPHARRVESVPMEPTYGVRMRETRRVAMRDALGALKWAWRARGRRAAIGSADESASESDRRQGRGQQSKRREEPELSIERLREKVRERDGSQGIDGAEPESRRSRRPGNREGSRDGSRDGAAARDAARDSGRERPRVERTAAADPSARSERPLRPERPARAEGSDQGAKPRREKADRPEREERLAAAPKPRPPKPPRGERPARPRREDSRAAADDGLLFDDPFAAPAPKLDPFARVLDARSDALPTTPSGKDEPRRANADATERATEDASATTSADADLGAAARTERSDRLRLGADVDVDGTQGATARADDARGDDTEAGENGEGDDAAAEGAESSTDAPTRKRRRNRRSRRGRKRREPGDIGEAGDASEARAAGEDEGSDRTDDAHDSAADASDTANDDASDRVTRRRPISRADEADRDAEVDTERDAGRDDDGDRDDGDASADGSEDESAAQRARRRGRRGRRGGARRSRGRRDRGDGRGNDETGGDAAGTSAPSSGPEGDD